MPTRRRFIRQGGVLAAGWSLGRSAAWDPGTNGTPCVRPVPADRRFTSEAVESTIRRIKSRFRDPALGCLFENCFPNTLDTTVEFETPEGRPDTFVITGDIDAMWLRDSTAQVWPYLPLTVEDRRLRELVAGVVNRQKKCILLDPYANAFYKDTTRKSEWSEDITAMKPGLHERKWEIDSLCYPIRLTHRYWKTTGDTGVLDAEWEESIRLTVQTFREQQRKDDDGPYTFQRRTHWATDGVPLSGYGYPVKPVGLICSVFRPSDDATIYPFLIPSNLFAVVSLRQASEMLRTVRRNPALAAECMSLSEEVSEALKKHGSTVHPVFGTILAYECNGFGSYNLMDDANIPSLLSLPYLDAIKGDDPLYVDTRRFVLSTENPFFFKGRAAEGVGGPHGGMHTIWPLAIAMRGLTSTDTREVRACLRTLKTTHAGTGFMHEAFHKDDPTRFSRKWFAWANTLFGEFVLHVEKHHPALMGETDV